VITWISKEVADAGLCAALLNREAKKRNQVKAAEESLHSGAHVICGFTTICSMASTQEFGWKPCNMMCFRFVTLTSAGSCKGLLCATLLTKQAYTSTHKHSCALSLTRFLV
jgi:hypothetical protein